MSLFIGIPTYNGYIHHTTLGGVAQAAHFCGGQKIGFTVQIIPHDAFVGRARNMLARLFLQSNFHELLFVDADIGFDIEGVIALCKAKPDIVMGLYRMKEDGPNESMKLKFPALLEDPLIRHASDPRLLKIQYGPAGFMRVRRSVFEKMIEKWPDDWYEDAHGKMHDFFPAGRIGNAFWGEDISFCQRAKECGFDLWAHQGIALTHHGEKSWPSNWQIDIQQEKAA